ncbi:MAG: sigma-70 family RNA polymerase sigma factor [Paludibacteraceae bacterium]|nr:sigma-70 family RNA polymerase sigma factor [Paludibacteraceae bacterium]
MKNISKFTDEELVKLYASGNNQAFELLIQRNKDRVYGYILFATKNNDLADDIFQEIFIKAIINIKKGNYTENGKFIAWINRIAHNLIIDHYRKTSYENTFSNDNNELNLSNSINIADRDIEDTLIWENQLNDIAKMIKFLPKEQKEVVVMRFYKNMSFNEIAEKTNVSINTALGRMRYAIINLKKMTKGKILETATFSA